MPATATDPLPAVLAVRLGAIALALLVLGVAARPALAQQTRAEPREGDLLWGFAQEEPFLDGRVRSAFILVVDAQALLESAGLWPEVQLLPADERDRAFERDFGAIPNPQAEALKLLLASGLDFSRLPAAGESHVWAALPPVEGSGPSVADRGSAAIALGAAFAEALESLDAGAGPCAVTRDPSAAQLLIWGYGETPATGGGAPAAPSTGNAGVAGAAGASEVSGALLLSAFAAGLAIGARGLTRRVSG